MTPQDAGLWRLWVYFYFFPISFFLSLYSFVFILSFFLFLVLFFLRVFFAPHSLEKTTKLGFSLLIGKKTARNLKLILIQNRNHNQNLNLNLDVHQSKNTFSNINMAAATATTATATRQPSQIPITAFAFGGTTCPFYQPCFSPVSHGPYCG